jgi:hypothetical protein
MEENCCETRALKNIRTGALKSRLQEEWKRSRRREALIGGSFKEFKGLIVVQVMTTEQSRLSKVQCRIGFGRTRVFLSIFPCCITLGVKKRLFQPRF